MDGVTGVPANFTAKRSTMEATGIAYKGLDGVTWRPGATPLELPRTLADDLQLLARAIFALYDAVAERYGNDPELTALLLHKVPERIPRIADRAPVSFIRPDCVVSNRDGRYRAVVTELESAPAGHGMTHAMQCAYGPSTVMADRFAEYLRGRPYLIIATHEWAEYFADQASFCKALTDRGVTAHMIFDAPLSTVQAAAATWRPPREAGPEVAARWNRDVLGRMERLGLAGIVSGVSPENLPRAVGNAVVFRFGYFDNFDHAVLDALRRWEQQGATIINPTCFYLENKALLAACQLESVRAGIRERGPELLDALDQGIARTWLLADPDQLDGFITRQKDLVTKYGAWDGQNQSWGSRSLLAGYQTSRRKWERTLEERLRLRHPVVAQRAITSARFDVPWVTREDTVALLTDARVRLTPFFLRDERGTIHDLGATVTLRQTFRVHGADDAVEAPVVFGKEELTDAPAA